MKYKNVTVTGHQRTGTHYICALVSKNFFETNDYTKFYVSHKLPKIVKDPNTLYVISHRDFESTAKSIFRMRNRFGLDVDSYDEFLNTKYKDMGKRFDNVSIKIRDLDGNIKETNKVSGYFSKIDQTPYEGWDNYHTIWHKTMEEKDNVYIMSYNQTVGYFDEKMKELAEKLGSSKTKFENINFKIGWNV